MAPVTMPPVEEARSIFSRLGYTVSGDGAELVAERKWRTVHVRALASEEATARRALADGGRDDGSGYRFRCFVTWKEATGDLRDRLRTLDPRYDWAVIGVDETGDYEVFQAEPPPAVRT